MSESTVDVVDKPSVWFDPVRNAWVYRASAIGNCSLQLQRFRTGLEGEPPPAWMAKRYKEGHLHEQSILDTIEAQRSGWTIHAEDPDHPGEEIEVEYWIRKAEDAADTGIVILGHIDGLAINPILNPDSRVAEAKAFSKDNYEKATRLLDRSQDKFWSAYPYYRDQITVYMAALEVPAFYGIKDRNSGEVTVFDVDEQPGDLEALIARVRIIEAKVESGDLDEECDVNSWPCPFYQLPPHVDDGDLDPEAIMADALGQGLDELDKDNTAEFDRLCKEYDIAREAEKSAKARKKEIGRNIAEQFLDEGMVETSNFKAHMKDHTYRWLDEDDMAADGIDPEVYRRERKSQYPNIIEKGKS